MSEGNSHYILGEETSPLLALPILSLRQENGTKAVNTHHLGNQSSEVRAESAVSPKLVCSVWSPNMLITTNVLYVSFI